MPSSKGNNLITDLRIPYKSFNSAVSTDLSFQDGANVLTTIPGYLERRPGFSAVAIPAPGGGFTGTVKIIYPWHRVSGTTTNYFAMICSVDNSQSYVYKFQFGSDSAAVLIHTCTTSNTPFYFVDSSQLCFFGKDDVANEMFKYDGTTLTKWGIARPSVVPTVSLSAGSQNITVGWFYRSGFGNSATGGLSTLSDLSACTGPGTSKQVGVGIVASTDAQVNQNHVFRTTDGGSTDPTEMQELPNSPFPNIGWTFTSVANASAGSTVYTGTPVGASGFASSVGQTFTVAGFTTGANNGAFACSAASASTITLSNSGGVAETHAATGNLTAIDNTADINLLTTFGPGLLQNDPPPAMKPLCVSQNRIWGIAGSKLFYSGFEEIGNGLPEECFPSGLDGNFRPYPSPLYSLAPTSTGVAIFSSKKIFGVDGDSLDTFRWGTILEKRGTKFPTNTAAVGGSVVWVDTSKQIWLSDIGEMGADIRTDTKLFTASLTQIAIHNSGDFNWVVFMDGQNGKLFVANMDNKHWLVPWPVSGVTAIASGETSDGTIDLLAAINGTIYKAVPDTYNDAGTPYKPFVKWNLFSIAPDETPDFYGVVDHIALETDSVIASDVRQLNDDDPRQIDISNWVSLKDNEQDSAQRSSQGTAVIRKEYTSQPETQNAQRISVYIEWPTADENFHLYSMNIKHHNNG